MRLPALIPVALVVTLLAACSGPAPRPLTSTGTISQAPLAVSEQGNEVALYALGLIDTGYRFGGKNPDAGLDCSGMVSYVFDQSVNLKLKGSAADIARRGRIVDIAYIQPGDLVFFNTMNKPLSHVGIYIGEGRFIHAPSSKGKVRIDSLAKGWFAPRLEEVRSYFD